MYLSFSSSSRCSLHHHPTQQILNAAGKSSTVLPTLKKGAPCAVRFLEALGNLFEKGAEVR